MTPRRLVATAVLIACATVAAGPTAVLQVKTDAGRVLVRRDIPAGEQWCLIWNHSVAGFPVRDCYRNDGGRMVLERSHQPDFAAGLGHIPGRGRQRSDGAGGYWIEEINEPVPGNAYLLWVGGMAVDHRLLVRGETISLSRAAAGERVRIRLRPAGDRGNRAGR